MPTLWIVQRDPRTRSALARLVGDEANLVLGGPSDRLFESVGNAEVVVLGIRSEMEAELEFAHRFGPRLPGTRWILMVEEVALDEAERLFDALAPIVLPYPAPRSALRRRIRAALAPESPDSLSARQRRDALAARFGLWFSDLELPELVRALDPRLADVPLIVRGESGTGRGLLTRYAHTFSGRRGPYRTISCRGQVDLPALEADVARALTRGHGGALTLCLEDVDRLAPALQRTLRHWIESGLPPELGSGSVSWMATAGETDAAPEGFDLDDGLEQALAGLAVRIAPLRERSGAIAGLATALAAAWGHGHIGRPRTLSEATLEALGEYPWPGNVQELDSVVARSLAANPDDPLDARDLRFDAGPSLLQELARTRPSSPPAGAGGSPRAAAPDAPRAFRRFAPLEGDGPPAQPAAPERVAPRAEPDRVISAEPAAAERVVPAPQAPAEVQPPRHERVIPAAEPEPEPAPAPVAAPPLARAEPAVPTPASPAAEALPSAAQTSTTSAVMDEADVRRLVGAIAHEVRNPLVTVRTFTELLPERFDDGDFRSRFHDVVGSDVRRIEQAVDQLSRLAGLSAPERDVVNVAALVETALEERRPAIEEHELVVLKELDKANSTALGDAEQLRFAFDALLGKALDAVPRGGHLYLASRRHPATAAGPASVRLLFRFRAQSGNPSSTVDSLAFADTALEITVAEAIVRMHGGSMTVNPHDPRETLVLVDLPAD